MPCDPGNYPPNWRTEIRPAIMARARNKCERCCVEHCSIILAKSRHLLVEPLPYKEARARVDCYHEPDERAIVVVLTIAHLDHDTRNNDEKNLAALCQKCHLLHDKHQHAANAARTRAAKTGQMMLHLPTSADQ